MEEFINNCTLHVYKYNTCEFTMYRVLIENVFGHKMAHFSATCTDLIFSFQDIIFSIDEWNLISMQCAETYYDV